MRYKYLMIFMASFYIWYSPHCTSAMSLHISDTDIRYILTAMAANNNMNIVIGNDVSGTVSVNLDDIMPLDAIKTIARINGLAVEEKNGIIYINSQQSIHNNYGNLHIFKVQYINPDTLADAVKMSFNINSSGNKNSSDTKGKNKSDDKAALPQKETVFVDKDINALLFYGTDSEAQRIADFIKDIDVPSRQVMLEAKVIAIQKDASKKLGIEWNWSQLPQYPTYEKTYESVRHLAKNAAGTYTTVTEDVPVTKVTRQYNVSSSIPGIIQFGKGPDGIPFEFYYGTTLNALITDGKASILAKPNIMAINNHEALIRIGSSIPIPQTSVTDSTATTSYEYHDTGIILRYTPSINDNGEITAKVHTEVSSPLYIEDLKAYQFQTRSADTSVRLKDGETMVIGGLIGSEEARSMSKIPFLGDLPILGNFFRSIKNSKSESEIIIFLTAHIKN